MMTWSNFIAEQSEQAYFKALQAFIEGEIASGKIIYPPKKDWFNAFTLTELKNVKVVILGQDPYHGAGQAHGLSFSVKEGVKPPPSLRNIFKALDSDLASFKLPNHGDLSGWAKQGVLLLNTVLTVEQSKAGSHANKGWEHFTDNVISHINENTEGVVFLLWGNYAIKKAHMLDQDKHHILTSVHPSPLSAYRGFFDCKHFSKANMLLRKQGKDDINW